MHRGLYIAVVVALSLVGAASASARTTITGTGQLPYQGWVDEAKVPTPDGEVLVVEMVDDQDPAWPCGAPYGYSLHGCIFPLEREIYLDPYKLAFNGTHWLDVRAVLWHELGHLFDVLYLTPEDRAWFASVLHLPADPWLSDQSHNTPGEWFAETYALCASYGGVYPKGGHDVIAVTPEDRVGAKRFKRLCRFVRFSYWR